MEKIYEYFNQLNELTENGKYCFKINITVNPIFELTLDSITDVIFKIDDKKGNELYRTIITNKSVSDSFDYINQFLYRGRPLKCAKFKKYNFDYEDDTSITLKENEIYEELIN